MKPIPPYIGSAKVICFTPIDERHRFTGNTRQIVAGKLQGPMSGFAICQYPNDAAFYLFGCNEEWEAVTDTWHESIENAKEQAKFEYENVEKTWIDTN